LRADGKDVRRTRDYRRDFLNTLGKDDAVGGTSRHMRGIAEK
jgi:hypothetical protein